MGVFFFFLVGGVVFNVRILVLEGDFKNDLLSENTC